MPKLSAWAVKASFVYLGLGFTWGALLLIQKAIAWNSALWQLLPSHIEFLLLGWLAQLILGVAFWILPRYGKGPPRGDERVAWAAFVLLNLGIWGVALSPAAGAVQSWLYLAGRAAQVAGGLAFAWHAWPRIKPLGK